MTDRAWKLSEDATLVDKVTAYVTSHGETTTERLRAVFPEHAGSISQAASRAKESGAIVSLGRGVYGPPTPAEEPAPAPVREDKRESPRVRIVKAFQYFRRGVAEGLVTQAEAEYGLWRSVERIICEEMA